MLEPTRNLRHQRTVFGQSLTVEIRCAFAVYPFAHAAPSASIGAGAKIPFRVEIAKRLVEPERAFRIVPSGNHSIAIIGASSSFELTESLIVVQAKFDCRQRRKRYLVRISHGIRQLVRRSIVGPAGSMPVVFVLALVDRDI